MKSFCNKMVAVISLKALRTGQSVFLPKRHILVVPVALAH